MHKSPSGENAVPLFKSIIELCMLYSFSYFCINSFHFFIRQLFFKRFIGFEFHKSLKITEIYSFMKKED